MKRALGHPQFSGAGTKVAAQAKARFSQIKPLATLPEEKTAGKGKPAKKSMRQPAYFAEAAQPPLSSTTNYPELISEEELAQERMRLLHVRAALQPIPLPQTHALAAGSGRKSRLELAWQWLSSAIISLISHLSSLSKSRRLTLRGEKALCGLQALCDLYFATSSLEGMDMVAFRAAFGEAYYSIFSESRRRRKFGVQPHDENYGRHLEQFARAASSLP